MKAILVDDEILAIEALKGLLHRVGGVDVVGTFTNPEKAIAALDELTVDVLFLDIEMGAAHGIDIAQVLIDKHSQLNIVFVTAHAEYAVDAFEVRSVDYLLKPIRKERLEETINRLKEQIELTVVKETLAAEPYLYINVLKSFQLYNNADEEMKWRTRKVKELFAYLWHHYPDPIPRGHIMEELWGEQHADNAVQLMHTSFYHLRKMIRDAGFKNPVHFANEQYTLEIHVKSDLCKLKKMMSATEFEDAEIEQMIEIYKGNYFEEENYPWALAKQEELKEKLLTIFEKFVLEKIDSGDLSQTVAVTLEKMIELDPYNERFVYLLIDYYGKTKNLQKVIKVAGHFEDVWTKELGIKIPDEISSIYYKYVTKKAE